MAAAAAVDPALVHHYFGSKDDLFLAALQIPLDPRRIVPAVFAEGVEGAAERLLQTFLSVWDNPQSRLPLVALVRTGLGGEPEHSLLHEGMLRLVFGPLREVLDDRADRRAQLVATQMLGLIVGRYLMRLEPLASMPADELIAWMAPNIQRYLTADLP